MALVSGESHARKTQVCGGPYLTTTLGHLAEHYRLNKLKSRVVLPSKGEPPPCGFHRGLRVFRKLSSALCVRWALVAGCACKVCGSSYNNGAALEKYVNNVACTLRKTTAQDFMGISNPDHTCRSAAICSCGVFAETITDSKVTLVTNPQLLNRTMTARCANSLPGKPVHTCVWEAIMFASRDREPNLSHEREAVWHCFDQRRHCTDTKLFLQL